MVSYIIFSNLKIEGKNYAIKIITFILTYKKIHIWKLIDKFRKILMGG